MNSAIDNLTKEALESGLQESSLIELENRVGESLGQELKILSTQGKSIPDWASGDFGSRELATRFIDKQLESFRKVLCDTKTKSLKKQYADLIQPSIAKAETISHLAKALRDVMSKTTPEFSIPSIAVYLAFWLIQNNLEKFCLARETSRPVPKVRK